MFSRYRSYLYVLSPSVSTLNVYSLKKGISTLSQAYNFGKKVKGVQLDPVNLAGAATYVV